MIFAKVVIVIRWLAGRDVPPHHNAPDDLEPYCTEQVLQARITTPLPEGVHKAVHKIGARYGAEL